MNRYREVGRGIDAPKWFEFVYMAKTSELGLLIIDVS